MNLSSAIQLTRKDLKLFFRDRTALLLSLVLPIALATVFGTAMKGMSGGGGGGGVKDLTLWVEDLDGSPQSTGLVERLDAAAGIAVKRETELEARVRNGKAAMALVIPAGYGAELEAGRIPRLDLMRDPSQPLTVQVLTARMLPAMVMQTIEGSRGPLFRRFLGDLGFPAPGLERAEAIFESTFDRMDALSEDLRTEGVETAGEGAESDAGGGFDFLTAAPKMLGIDARDVSSEEGRPPSSAGVSHAFSAMAVMMLMFSLVAGAGSLLDEQQQGTLLRLRLVPGAADAILLGKGLFLAAIGAMQLSLLFLYGMLVFKVPVLEHILEVLVISLAVLAAVSAMGMVFASYCRTRKQLEGSSTLLILIMSAVGGAWFPREMTPDWFQAAGKFTLTAWAMDAYHGALWYGKKLWPSGQMQGIWPEVAVLLAVALVLALVARRAYHRRFGRAAA
ncbi:MAG: ABC transporter permease [Planctomycetota bacterium]